MESKPFRTLASDLVEKDLKYAIMWSGKGTNCKLGNMTEFTLQESQNE